MRNCSFFLVVVLAAAPGVAADSGPLGVWKTIDDTTHQPRALIRLFEKDGEIYGRVESSFDPKEAHERCEKCSGDRRDQPVVGMVILRHMKKHGSEYSGGDIVDPETGWVYKCKFNLEDGGRKMIVRGFLGISLLGRSQTWYRVDPASE